jgi:amino acid adenylation domain-containing protein
MKAGAVYVPLDPSAPVSRLGTVIRDCGIRHLISSDDKKNRLGELLAQNVTLEFLIGLDEQVSLLARSFSWQDVYQMPSQEMPDVGTGEHDLAYILYTSGSTGKPKGIMHSHRSALSFAQWARQTYGLTHQDRLSNHAPLHFDLSTFDFFAGALAGATTVMIPEVYKKLPASLSKLIADAQISVWYSVPFALTELLLRGVLESRDLTALRWILFAGEPFPTKHLRKLMKMLPHARFSNLYGPTETNVCTYYHVPPLPDQSNEPIPIGRPTANASSLVVNAKDQPLGAKQVGELLIQGPLVMRGYWGRPALNQEAFLQAKEQNGEGLFYRTGDLVELQPDGNFKFIGRKDRQIKRRGYRIELDEIEVALLSHAQVQEAAVFPLSDRHGSNEIEAVVTLKAGALLELSDLAQYLTEQLPWYAIPNHITIAKELPRTSTGKINRRHLQKEASQAKNIKTNS